MYLFIHLQSSVSSRPQPLNWANPPFFPVQGAKQERQPDLRNTEEQSDIQRAIKKEQHSDIQRAIKKKKKRAPHFKLDWGFQGYMGDFKPNIF